jgi:hypothetical protein
MIAALILHNILRGRKKALWVSSSPILKESAVFDLKTLGCGVSVIGIEDLQKRKNRNPPKQGILFTTYATLGSIGTRKAGKTSRYSQIMEWLGGDFDGVVSQPALLYLKIPIELC